MEFLPTTLGTRPRLAVEVRAEGVVAARAEDASGVLTAVARAELGHAALAPGLKAGNVVDRTLVSGAIRSALDAVVKGSDRSRDVTLVVPDAAVRVLLLEFEQLPSKLAEALPVVRFRLKKLLPFEADDAMVSYQVMASAKGSVQVMAVAEACFSRQPTLPQPQGLPLGTTVMWPSSPAMPSRPCMTRLL